jgi:protein O-mannosyl-transferase
VKRQPRGTKAPAAPPKWPAWGWWPGALAALLAAFLVYDPALDGPFVLDDNYLPYGRPEAARFPLEVWLAGRPVLGLTYYANYLMSGSRPAPYHIANLLLHFCVTCLVFVILRLVQAKGPKADWIALIGAGIFLFHPIQTEAVAYVAGRSDVLCTLFAYAALAVFLTYRRPAIGFGAVAATLGLSLLALLSKQQAVAIPAVLILIDLLWNDGSAMESIRRNIRLHGLLVAGAAAGAVWVFSGLATGTTAGLRVPGLTPTTYFLTQCRVFWRYVQLLILPVGQNLDPDFAISRGLFDGGAIFGLLAIAALLGGAIWLRRSWPLASAGVLIFLALLAPTSSFVPIQDPVAERRVYFAMIGPLLIVTDLLRRWQTPVTKLAGAGAALAVLLGVAAHSRAALWGDEMALWRDTVAQSPDKMRPHFQLGHLYYRSQRCPEAAKEYETAAKLAQPTTELLVDWGLALDCSGRTPEAIERLRQAVAAERTYNSLAQLGMVLARQGKLDEALPLLNEALKIETNQAAGYGYRGNVYATLRKFDEAKADFEKALSLNPADPAATRGLEYVRQQQQLLK